MRTTRSGARRNDRDLNLYQAFLFIGNHKEFPLSLKIGRQELVYGDQPSLGHLRWGNNARSFDAIKLRWQNAFFGGRCLHGRARLRGHHNFNPPHSDDSFFRACISIFPTFPSSRKKNLVERSSTPATSPRQPKVNVDANNNPYSGVAAPFRNPANQDPTGRSAL